MWSRGQQEVKHTTPSNSWENAKYHWDSQINKNRALQFSGILIPQGTNPMTLFLLYVSKFPPWSWPCTLALIKADSLKGFWYHLQPRIWAVKIMPEKWLQMPAPPLPNKWLTVQFSICSNTRLCFAAPNWIPTSLSGMSLGGSPLCSWRLSCLSSQLSTWEDQKNSWYSTAFAVTPEMPLAWCLCYPVSVQRSRLVQLSYLGVFKLVSRSGNWWG